MVPVKHAIAGLAAASMAAGIGLFATSGAALAATPSVAGAVAARTVVVPQNRHFDGHRWRDRRSCDVWSQHGNWHGDRRHFDCRFVGGWWEYWTD